MQKGKINVQTENIFPIIKKFLYSDHEIFLRELVSNAVDATQKLKTLASVGKYNDELGDLTIQINVDKKAGTISIVDRGIGMNAEELDKYINQIAFSSAEEFVKKFKTKSEAEQNAIIGHFGLGFYSAFMVANKVVLKTKTYKKGGQTKAMQWECDGSPEYSIKEIDKKERGTEVIVHIDKDSKEFLDEQRILGLLNNTANSCQSRYNLVRKRSVKQLKGKRIRMEMKRPKRLKSLASSIIQTHCGRKLLLIAQMKIIRTFTGNYTP